jgi:L-alanine-DL-glutamate epimerase-like enolase superfamily enzyme
MIMMKITSAEVWECRVPLARPLDLGNLMIRDRDYTIVRIRDSDGAEGVAWGYCRGADIASTIRRNLFPRITGVECGSNGSWWQRLYEANRYVNQGGIFLRALSLCDIAIWELQAARDGVSLAQAVGARPLAGPVTVAGCYPIVGKSPRDDAAEAADLVARGYRSIKLCATDGGPKDTERLCAVRESIGATIELKVDVHWLWSSAKQAIPVLRAWEDLKVAWVEDGFETDSLSELSELKKLTSIPLAYGDEQNGRVLHEQLINSGALSVLRLDATVVGGITEFIRIGRKANAAGLRVSGHIFEEYHSAALGVLDNATNIERFEPDSGLDGIDELRQITRDGCTWDWAAVDKYRLHEK